MKHKIVETSIQLFEQKGFKETSIQDIAHALGVTKGTFYYYFTSKEQVLITIHRGYIDHLMEEQMAIMNRSDWTYTEKLHGLVEMLLRNIAPRGRSARVFFREFRHLSDENLEEIRAKRDRVRFAMEEVIRSGISAGEFRPDLEADIVTLGILGACNWSYQWFNPDGQKTDKQIATVYTDMVLSGIRNDSNEYQAYNGASIVAEK
ncbi:TetR/AcrR family transcriptional regulator [Thalassobacillus sp. CUG 92003]|uniref:TetR/AcrR family transcriptional regulator n=1 Tax=Thalassobacillus sp. CUG 92003 TaxID=2736641 RepID=UPI0015E74408|nr:TetR/AcrR family transcriptional regulator [Thalassobacillus sp. CUG 92003]